MNIRQSKSKPDQFQKGYLAALKYAVDLLPNSHNPELKTELTHYRNHILDDIESLSSKLKK